MNFETVTRFNKEDLNNFVLDFDTIHQEATPPFVTLQCKVQYDTIIKK